MGPHLGEELRDGDTLARLGGDEFAVLLPGAGAAVAVSVAERPFVIDGQALSVGASVGIACSPEHASDAGTLLRRADVAMYQRRPVRCPPHSREESRRAHARVASSTRSASSCSSASALCVPRRTKTSPP
ncbi:MAG: GGDEF domain-containing protein, partial [Chloroflexi bacterium]|nr:GGDEF domain-containing protein [Chloroflexota bacterium]